MRGQDLNLHTPMNGYLDMLGYRHANGAVGFEPTYQVATSALPLGYTPTVNTCYKRNWGG